MQRQLRKQQKQQKILMRQRFQENYNVDGAKLAPSLVKGKDVPGFQTGYSKTNRKWDDDAEEFLTKELGKDAWQKILITLGKAEKLLGKEIVADHTVKPQGKIIAIKMKQQFTNHFNCERIIMFKNLKSLKEKSNV